MTSTGRRFRVYLMAYLPPGMPDPTNEQIVQMMRDCDFCFTRGLGEAVELGEIVTVSRADIGLDRGGAPGLGAQLRCIGHEHGGKVVIVEEVNTAS